MSKKCCGRMSSILPPSCFEHLINRHGADRHGRGVDDRLADAVDIAAGRKVHHRVGAEMHGRVQLFQLGIDIAGDGRVADIGVDLGAGGDADAHRLQPLLEMLVIGRDDHPAAGDFRADQFRFERFALGDEFHLGRDRAGTGLFDLGHG